MELKLNKEALCVNEVVYDGISEQSVEFDYILPDYYPAIFKILKCQLTPRIMSYNTTSDRLTFDAVVQIKVLYCAEDSATVKCVDQRFSFSKTVEFNRACQRPQVSITPKLDYCNCRAVSERRLDIRGAVSCKVRVSCTSPREVIAGASGMGMQTRKSMVRYDGGRLYTAKQTTVREAIELGASKPAAQAVIRYDAVATAGDCKLIANKVIAKGEVLLSVLYAAEDGEHQALESLQATIPVSQIVDLDGVNEEYACYVDMDIAGCDIVIKQASDGQNRILSAEFVIMTACSAHREDTVAFVQDAFSTDYNSSYAMDRIKLELPPTRIAQTFMAENTVEYGEGAISCVCDAWGSVSNVSTKALSPEEIVVSCTVTSCVLARDTQGNTIFLEGSDIVDHSIQVAGISENSVFSPTVCVQSVSYSLASNNAVVVRCEICIRGCLYNMVVIDAARELTVDETNPKQKDTAYALKMYYADEGENVWDIAKRFNTSIGAIMDENDLESEVLPSRGMILIPIIS